MTTEGQKAAFDRIASVRNSMVEISGRTGNLSPLLGVNTVLENVVRALQEGATLDDFRPLTDPSLTRTLIARAHQAYNEYLVDCADWAKRTFGS